MLHRDQRKYYFGMPFEPNDAIHDAVQRLLTMRDGFVIFRGRDIDLVENFTTAAFERVYGRFAVSHVNIRLDA